MFATVEDVEKLTGYVVTNNTIFRAQALMETYAGKIEEEVQNVNDRALMARAVAYQSAYMHANYDRVFEQIALTSVSQADGGLTIDRERWAPYMAPLAIMSMRMLSWRTSRSIKTGSILGRSRIPRWETD